ncbi:Bacterial protein of unknown function (DUF881) [Acididesulfobacillus acetoxydans]|uniref:DUF881 domain-containing protein n=1 Tax=Acididesulfobacillus acetoxydans TaxID=1561005 RepID=A0A8S0WE76_9FIRM|nr:DUF881 domain-containing protein [Acididesulfobacillus acetoxydans]CAA7599912.1 Bacterial protein of unknown function (DUF881) [Acididesulfobacillus acetoxydans]CEJ06874.1 Bacterial protein of unknown function (DUF881) [Acididesulfobacillus acetoxydans]
MKRWKRRLALPVSLVAIALGFLISLAMQTQKNVSAAEEINARRMAAAHAVLSNVQGQNAQLKKINKELTAQLAQDRSLGGTDPKVLAQLAQVEIQAGSSKVQGPGVQIFIDDRKQDHNLTLPLSPDNLLEIINTLKFAGAEAISVNGQRIVDSTAIVYSGSSTILVNQVPITRVEGIPYEIDAIGNQNTLVDFFTNLEGSMLKANGITFSIMRKTVEVPAYKGAWTFRYARAD